MVGTFGWVEFLILVLFLGPLYFLPSIVAFMRGHVNRRAILILNLFLGWTAIGWLVVMVWAFVRD